MQATSDLKLLEAYLIQHGLLFLPGIEEVLLLFFFLDLILFVRIALDILSCFLGRTVEAWVIHDGSCMRVWWLRRMERAKWEKDEWQQGILDRSK